MTGDDMMYVREVVAAAERERCAAMADALAAQYDAGEKGCWNDGESAGNALRILAAKIRGAA